MPRLLLVSLTAAFALLLAGCDRQSATTAQEDAHETAQKENSGPPKHPSLTGTVDREKAGADLPQVTVTHPDGTKLNLADLAGEPVLLNIWATWCAPCVHEMPMLDELANDMDGDLRVVTVSQDIKGAELVEPFFEKGGYTKLEPWLDPANDLMFGIQDANVLPTTILYGANGKEVLRVVGGYAWNSAEAKGLVEEAL